MRTPRIFLIVVLALTLSLHAIPAGAGTRAARYRAKLYGFVNDYRAQHGRRPLQNNAKLSTFAWNHSKRMAQARTLYHSTALDSKARSLGASTWGENIGMGRSIFQVFVAWRNSAPHRANMLSGRFRRAGIGVVRAHGAFWITLDLYG
jgi:uncharacterized protein YkwD